MRQFIVECWDSVMSHDFNPLKHIPDLQVRHMVLQILAWMWCIAFSLYVGSWYVMGVTFATHFLLIAAIAITIATFKISFYPFLLEGVALIPELNQSDGKHPNREGIQIISKNLANTIKSIIN